jgi:type VI secretion system secreted protein VgrG
MATKTVKNYEAVFVPPAGLDAEDLLFRRMSAREALGRLPLYEVELLREQRQAGSTSPRPAVKADAVLGKTAAVKLRLSKDKYRYFHGLVTRFRRGGAEGRYDIYHVELRPWLWFLTLGADCRIFQDKAADEIIKLVFDDYKSSVQLQDMCDGVFRKRPYTVQYRESDFDFVSRLMEEEGIYYFFKHEEKKHTLVLCNGPRGHNPIAGNDLHWAASVSDNQLREDIITDWVLAHELRSLKYSHTDYAAEAPAADLKKDAARTVPYPAPGDLEVFDYPGGYDDIAMKEGSTSTKTQEAERLAKLRVDAMETGHVIAEALTPSRDVSLGMTFNFKGHDAADGYLVALADYEMAYGGYEANYGDGQFEFMCTLEAVPKETRFQPHARIQRPLIAGPQTATVVGPKGDEIHTDKYGRVKVKFHWDRVGKKDEKASCFVRVAFPWASKQFGMVALPRVGDEVVVEFLEGNPDRPLITGAVYNGTNMPPYELPAQATVSGIRSRSSKGGGADNRNELRFDDKKGSEYVWMHAERDFKRVIKNDLLDSVGNNSQFDVTKNHTVNIGEALDVTIGKAAQLKIGADTSAEITGDLNLNVKAATNVKLDDKLALKVAQAVAVSGGMAVDVDAGMDMKANAGMNMHLKGGMSINIDAGMKISLKAGPASITLGPDGVSITGPMVKINSGGAASPATKATKASPAAPKAPKKVAENKDPLAK